MGKIPVSYTHLDVYKRQKMHNALHGVDVEVSLKELMYFQEVNRQNAKEMDLCGDILFIHDPQPIALVEQKETLGKKWVWRCHIDFTTPKEEVMAFLKLYIEKYDSAVFSAPAFARKLSIPQAVSYTHLDVYKRQQVMQGSKVIEIRNAGIDKGKAALYFLSKADYDFVLAIGDDRTDERCV